MPVAFQIDMPVRRGWRHLRAFLFSRKWPSVVLGCIAGILGMLFIAQDKATLDVRSAVGAADARFAPYLGSQLNAPVSRGNDITVLQNGDEIFPPMLEAIAAAKSRIDFESYIFSGNIAESFVRALVDAARRGVAVRVVLDAIGVPVPPAGLEEQFESAGVRMVWFNPVGTWTLEKANYRTHRKLLIVDGSVGFTGGAGVADRWLGQARHPDEWRDTQFRVTGPAVQVLEAAFFENWTESGGDAAPFFDPADPPRTRSAPTVTVWSNASEGLNDVKLMYLYAIAAARVSLDIQSPYFILDSSLRLSLANAMRRGVRIRVLTDGEVTDTHSVKNASRNEYEELFDQGAQIFEFQPTMMHSKVMIVDGVLSVFGTANFDNRSLELNDEVALAVADPQVADTLTRAFEQDLTRSATWTADEWRRRPFHRKIRERFWGLFSEVF